MWNRFVDVVSDFCATPAPPTSAGARVEHAAPSFLAYRLVLWALVRLSVLAGIVASMVAIELAIESGNPRLGFVPLLLRGVEGGALGVWVLSLPVGIALVRLDYEQRWYVISDRSLRIREGVVVVRDMTLTFVNVQNVTVEQGPIQRLFGIADLRVQTAGGGGSEQPGQPSMHTGWLRGIADAQALRELIMRRLRAAADAGLGDLDDQARRPDAEAEAIAALLSEARLLAGAARRFAAMRSDGTGAERST